MKTIFATDMRKDQQCAEKELEQIIKGMLFTRLLKRTYSIEDVLLLYVPFAISEYKILNTGKTKKARRLGHMFISTDVSCGRMKPFGEVSSLDFKQVEVEDHTVANIKPDLPAIKEATRKELVFKVLPRNLKSWREYETELLDCQIVYRPVWVMRYRLFNKMKAYKTFGDAYNL